VSIAIEIIDAPVEAMAALLDIEKEAAKEINDFYSRFYERIQLGDYPDWMKCE
jgi:hypothetical protein